MNLSITGQPTRSLALRVRSTAELIAEKLRRLDPDAAYAAALPTAVTPPSQPRTNQEPEHD